YIASLHSVISLAVICTLSLHDALPIFRGWNDGGQGASMANGFLSRSWHAEKFASIDSESFFDFQSTRPHVTLVEGTVRRIDWPEDRKSTRLNSSHRTISYAVFCLKKQQ